MRCVRNVRQALHRAPASHPAGPKLAAALGSPAAARPRRNLVATAARLTAPWRPPARTCGSSAGSWSACSPGSSGTRRPPPRPRSASRRRCTRPCRAAARAQGCKVRPTHATQQWSAWTSAALTQRFCSPASKLLFELQPCRRAVTHGLTPPRYTWHSGRTLTRGTPKHKQHRVASRARTTWPWRPGHRRRTCPRGSCAKGTTQRARGGAAAGAASAGVQGRALGRAPLLAPRGRAAAVQAAMVHLAARRQAVRPRGAPPSAHQTGHSGTGHSGGILQPPG